MFLELENELQAQLHGATAARPDDGIGGGYVRRGTLATERAGRRIVLTKTILSTVGIGKVGMVEDVEEFGAELHAEPFREMPVLGDGEIKVPEAGIAESVATHVPELSERRRNHDRAALRVAAKRGERRGGRASRSSSVQGEALCVAT